MELCKQLRAPRIRTPIVVFSGIEEETETVLPLEVGADDCVVKPFGPRELLARIRAPLRRARETTQNRAFGDIEVDVTRRIVTKCGMEVKLTPLESNLLAYFLEHPGWVVTREMVPNSVGGYDFCPNTRSFDAHLVRLRQKLEPDKCGCTVHGVGYRFVPEDEARVFDGGREKDKRRIPRGFTRGARWALICGSR